MKRMSRIAFLVLAALALGWLGCGSVLPDTFSDGTYTGTVGQTLTINGEDYTYAYVGITVEGHYVLSGTNVTFITTKVNGTVTGIEQKATYDVIFTTSTITLTDMRDMVNGGSGIAPDTFTK